MLSIMIGVTAAAFLAEWIAVGREARRWRQLTKPGAMVALIVTALVANPFADDRPLSTTAALIMVIGLVLSLAGDVFLLGDDRWFLPGLIAFFVAHVAYSIAMVTAVDAVLGAIIVLLVVLGAASWLGRRLLGALADTGQHAMRGPVLAYIAVISAMVVLAGGTRSVWAIGGAGLFYVSDAVLAWNRFVRPIRMGGLIVMVCYLLGQAGLVTWLIRG